MLAKGHRIGKKPPLDVRIRHSNDDLGEECFVQRLRYFPPSSRYSNVVRINHHDEKVRRTTCTSEHRLEGRKLSLESRNPEPSRRHVHGDR